MMLLPCARGIVACVYAVSIQSRCVQKLSQSHGQRAMLKYMHLLSRSSTACEKFVRRGDGAKVLLELMTEAPNR
jgi:hypothetical protein